MAINHVSGGLTCCRSCSVCDDNKVESRSESKCKSWVGLGCRELLTHEAKVLHDRYYVTCRLVPRLTPGVRKEIV